MCGVRYMDIRERLTASKKISKVNWNEEINDIKLNTYWCRVVINRWENWNYKEHSHSFFELHLALDGECVFEIDEKKITVGRGEFILIPIGKSHRIAHVSEDFEKFVWGFSVCDKETSKALARNCENVLLHFADKNMLSSVDIILDNAGDGIFENYNVIKGQMYFIFVSVLRKLNFISDAGNLPQMKSGVLTESVKKFISDNIALDFSLKDIADNFFISERQLCRICKAESGRTVREIKAEIQLEHIRRLLGETELSIEEIAIKSGFSDRYSLSKFFKKHEGLSPAVYRASLKK